MNRHRKKTGDPVIVRVLGLFAVCGSEFAPEIIETLSPVAEHIRDVIIFFGEIVRRKCINVFADAGNSDPGFDFSVLIDHIRYMHFDFPGGVGVFEVECQLGHFVFSLCDV